jgi:hypothetical protein
MKHSTNIIKTLIAVIAISFFFTSCSPWHYKNPRVRIDRQDPAVQEEVSNKDIQTESVTSQAIDIEKASILKDSIKQKESLNTEVASIDHKKVELSVTKKSAQHMPAQKRVSKKTTKMSGNFFERALKSQPFFKVKDVEKSALSGWVRIMVILFVVGFILVILGILLSVFLYPGFWWLFYFLGTLCILAGFIVLILGLVGVMA